MNQNNKKPEKELPIDFLPNLQSEMSKKLAPTAEIFKKIIEDQTIKPPTDKPTTELEIKYNDSHPKTLTNEENCEPKPENHTQIQTHFRGLQLLDKTPKKISGPPNTGPVPERTPTDEESKSTQASIDRFKNGKTVIFDPKELDRD